MSAVLAPESQLRPTAASDQSRTVYDLQIGDTLSVGDDVTLKVLAKSGKRARLLICAPKAAEINHREGPGFVPSI